MSNEEFSKLWSEDSAAGLEAFVHGLADAGAQGESMSAILSELGIKGIRESDTFLRLAANADGLTEALALGNSEFERNLALVQEAAKRYETTESQIQIAKNSLVDAGIEIGASVLPVLADVAGGVADLASWFADLPEPVQRSVTGLGAMAGATGLLAGGLMRVVPSAIATVNAFKDLRSTSPQVASGLQKVAGFATRAGIAFVGLQAAGAVADQFRDAATTSEEMAAGLLNIAQQSGVSKAGLDELFTATGTGNAEVRDLAHAIEILDAGALAKAGDFLASGLGVWDTQTEVAKQQIGELDRALSSLYQSGNAELVGQVLAESGVAVEDLIEYMPTLRTELTNTATAMGLEADAATLARIATGDLVPVVDDTTGAVTGYQEATDGATGAVEEQVDALAELQNLLQGTADLLLGVRGSARDFEAAMDDATAAVERNGKTLDISTEAGRANQEALDGIADSTHRWANEVEEAGGSAVELDGIMRQGRDAFIASAEAMGMSTEEAKALADELQLIPGEYQAKVDVHTDEAIVQIDKTKGGLQGIVSMEPHVDISVDADSAVISAEQATAAIESIPAIATAVVDGDMSGLQTTADSAFLLLAYLEAENPTPTAQLDDTSLVLTVQAATTRLDELDQMEPTPEVKAEKAVLERVVAGAKSDLDSIPDETIAKVQADTYGKSDVDSLRAAISLVNSKSVTITTTFRTIGTQPTMTRGRTTAVGALADGGWVNPGLSDGGWVPGGYPGPGIDNVLWPYAPGAAGGRYLAQPLAGDEFVVKGSQARIWGSALEAINDGLMPRDLAPQQAAATVTYAPTIQGLNAYEVARESRAEMQHVLRSQIPTFAR